MIEYILLLGMGIAIIAYIGYSIRKKKQILEWDISKYESGLPLFNRRWVLHGDFIELHRHLNKSIQNRPGSRIQFKREKNKIYFNFPWTSVPIVFWNINIIPFYGILFKEQGDQIKLTSKVDISVPVFVLGITLMFGKYFIIPLVLFLLIMILPMILLNQSKSTKIVESVDKYLNNALNDAPQF